MDGMRYVFCYDITSNDRRRRAAICLEGYGDRRQKSVFEAILDVGLFENCVDELNRVIEPSKDSVIAYPLCANCEGKRVKLGVAEGQEIGNEAVFIV